MARASWKIIPGDVIYAVGLSMPDGSFAKFTGSPTKPDAERALKKLIARYGQHGEKVTAEILSTLDIPYDLIATPDGGETMAAAKKQSKRSRSSKRSTAKRSSKKSSAAKKKNGPARKAQQRAAGLTAGKKQPKKNGNGKNGNGKKVPKGKKQCARCQKVKKLDAFPKNKWNADGRTHYCRDCWKEYRAAKAAEK